MEFAVSGPPEVLLLDRVSLERCLDLPAVIDAVGEGFADYYRGNAEVPQIAHLIVSEHDGEIDVKTGYLPRLRTVSVKVAAGFFRNEAAFGLPTGSGTIVLLDATTGFPLSVMDGDFITGMRTGAAGAVAARHLARSDSENVLIVGAGTQAYVQLLGLIHVLPDLTHVWVYDKLPDKAELFRRTMSRPGLRIHVAGSIEEGAKTADVIVTVTPSRFPYLDREWVKMGAHLNAIGSDGPGKQELDPRILRDADKLVVDSWDQAKDLGECQHALAAGYLPAGRDSIYAEIGALVAGALPGRQRQDELTVFDSTGIAVQDVAIATLAYRTAVERNMGTHFQFSTRDRACGSSPTQ